MRLKEMTQQELAPHMQAMSTISRGWHIVGFDDKLLFEGNLSLGPYRWKVFVPHRRDATGHPVYETYRSRLSFIWHNWFRYS